MFCYDRIDFICIRVNLCPKKIPIFIKSHCMEFSKDMVDYAERVGIKWSNA